MFIIYPYLLISVIVIITAFNAAGLSAGGSAFGTSILSFFAGSGLKGSFYGTRGQKLAGACAALVLMGISHWLGAGFSVHILGIDLTGTQWGWIGFFICLLFTTKRMGSV
jgi:hypothetical protein